MQLFVKAVIAINLLFLLLWATAGSARTESLLDAVDIEADQVFDQVVSWRREIHERPELGSGGRNHVHKPVFMLIVLLLTACASSPQTQNTAVRSDTKTATRCSALAEASVRDTALTFKTPHLLKSLF